VEPTLPVRRKLASERERDGPKAAPLFLNA
jgi:hypothetical protein